MTRPVPSQPTPEPTKQQNHRGISRSDDERDSHRRLVLMHKRIAQRLYRPHPQRLVQLRRRRLAVQCRRAIVHAQVERKHRDTKRSWESFVSSNPRPYYYYYYKPHEHSTEQQRKQQQQLSLPNLGPRVRTYRHMRQLVAAYRLAGISLWPVDETTVAMRWDILLDENDNNGQFVACYHAFWDLVVRPSSSSSNMNNNNIKKKSSGKRKKKKNDQDAEQGEDLLYLRMVQHTLPSALPVRDFLRQCQLETEVGPLGNEKRWRVMQLLENWRLFAQNIHTAARCHCMRKAAVDHLKELARNERSLVDDDSSDAGLVIQDIEVAEKFTQLSFCLQMTKSGPPFSVMLSYNDPLQAQPTQVKVKPTRQNTKRAKRRYHIARRRGGPDIVESEGEDRGEYETSDSDSSRDEQATWIEYAVSCFLRLTVPKALKAFLSSEKQTV